MSEAGDHISEGRPAVSTEGESHTCTADPIITVNQRREVNLMSVTFQDKRNATKNYKDMYTELSITRAKTEREMDELRENLRLAHHALDLTSP